MKDSDSEGKQGLARLVIESRLMMARSGTENVKNGREEARERKEQRMKRMKALHIQCSKMLIDMVPLGH